MDSREVGKIGALHVIGIKLGRLSDYSVNISDDTPTVPRVLRSRIKSLMFRVLALQSVRTGSM